MSSRFQVGDIVRKVYGEPWLGKVLKIDGDHLIVEFNWKATPSWGMSRRIPWRCFKNLAVKGPVWMNRPSLFGRRHFNRK
jgi:hypothetical protein